MIIEMFPRIFESIKLIIPDSRNFYLIFVNFVQ
jgi:hypothetical protein